MFNPEENRVDYGKILTPPDGFDLGFAIGTTYSLDLNALVGACMSLGLGAETESKLFDNKIFMLDVLRKACDKFVLFCEAGQIHYPSKVTPLFALLENSVFQVALKGRKTAYPSFHPKFWLIEYVNAKRKKRYRLIVLSRNLTFDKSWDITVSLDGFVTSEPTKKNEPIKDFLEFLLNYLPKTESGRKRKSEISRLVKALDYVEFRTEHKAFESVDFIPLGIKEYSIRNYPLFGKNKYYELLVMSPFLSKSTISELNGRWKKSTVKPALFTRKQSLSDFNTDNCGNFDVYCLRDEVVNGETNDETKYERDIHAKLYLLRDGFYSDAEVYLGSMNASDNAMNGNVEFMVRLTCKRKYLTLESLKKQLFCGEYDDARNPFEQITDVEKLSFDAEAEENLDAIIKAICRSNPHAAVTPHDDNYDVIVEFGKKQLSDNVLIRPLFSYGEKPLAAVVEFNGVSLKELSKLYKITVRGNRKTVERIITIPTDGIPDERYEAVVAAIIPDSKSFYAYLSFMLEDNPTFGAAEALRILAENGENYGVNGKVPVAALYEKLLKTAATDPKKFDDVEYVMKAIRNEDIVPNEFAELFDTFKKAVK